MEKDRRVKKSSKGLFFYKISTFIFFSMAMTAFIYCCIQGFTDTRVVLILMNGWFGLFTMNMMSVRFKRSEEKQFWYDWKIFQRGQPTGFDIVPELLDNNRIIESDDLQNKQDKKDAA
jgi:hypothetical protein